MLLKNVLYVVIIVVKIHSVLDVTLSLSLLLAVKMDSHGDGLHLSRNRKSLFHHH